MGGGGAYGSGDEWGKYSLQVLPAIDQVPVIIGLALVALKRLLQVSNGVARDAAPAVVEDTTVSNAVVF
jgi:hypothetical protein